MARAKHDCPCMAEARAPLRGPGRRRRARRPLWCPCRGPGSSLAHFWHICLLCWCQSCAIVAHMDLRPYIDEIHRQLEAAADAGGEEARALAERLVAPLDAAIRLSLLDALAAAAQEITCDLAPGSVEVRLRGRDPEFVVTSPAEPAGDDRAAGAGTTSDDWPAGGAAGLNAAAGDEGGMARINLRMPDHLKARVDQAAAGEGLSVNAWLVRAAAAALERADPSRRLERQRPAGRAALHRLGPLRPHHHHTQRKDCHAYLRHPPADLGHR